MRRPRWISAAALLLVACLAGPALADDPAPPTSAAASAAAAGKTPEDRATAFRPVEGGTQMRSGAKLLVSAYSILWVILMGYIVIVWRQEAALRARIDELEKAVDRAEAKKG